MTLGHVIPRTAGPVKLPLPLSVEPPDTTLMNIRQPRDGGLAVIRGWQALSEHEYLLFRIDGLLNGIDAESRNIGF